MTATRIAIALSILNLAVLAGVSARLSSVEAQAPPGILRGSGLEIVDDAGRVRASIQVLAAKGDELETVLLRLIDAAGQPSVKIATSGLASGLSFVGGDDLSYVILEAAGPDAALKLVEADGGETTIAPE